MAKKGILTQILAVLGTVLVWFPILAPVLLSVPGMARGRTFHFDWLMPAELFPFALAGLVLLLWAALRARSQVKLIAWGIGITALSLLGGQALASLTGLASGETEPAGWPWAMVLGSIALYALALMVIGVGGILLLRDLFRRPQLPQASD